MNSYCPCCLNNSFEPLIGFGKIPHSGTFLLNPKDQYHTIELSFEFCTNCALIRQKMPPESIEGGINYEKIYRTTGHQLPDYAVEITKALIHKGLRYDDLVVEIGANDGTFLSFLANSGFNNLLGVEPSASCAALSRAKGHKIEEVHLNQKEALRIRENYGLAKAVICRHTIEHVPDPISFLRAMKLILHNDGVLLIEVPDARRIIRDLRGHELWDEHLYSFTIESISYLLRKEGFIVRDFYMRNHLESVNILLYCGIGCEDVLHRTSFSEASSEVELCKNFEERWSTYSNRLLTDLSGWKKPVSVIGASHPQSNFLLYTGMGNFTDLMIDDDPVKIGKYVPTPKPIPVVSTSEFLNSPVPGSILRTAFGYERWMDKICRSLSSNGALIINPYS